MFRSEGLRVSRFLSPLNLCVSVLTAGERDEEQRPEERHQAQQQTTTDHPQGPRAALGEGSGGPRQPDLEEASFITWGDPLLDEPA